MRRLICFLLLSGGAFFPNLPVFAQSSDSPAAYQSYIECYNALLYGNSRNVVQFCSHALKSGGLDGIDRVNALIYRALAYKKMGHNDSALNDYNSALKLAPDDSIVLGNRGNLYREMARYELALRDLDRALNLDSKNAPAHFALGLTHEILGNTVAARTNFLRAEMLWPGNSEIRRKALQYRSQ